MDQTQFEADLAQLSQSWLVRLLVCLLLLVLIFYIADDVTHSARMFYDDTAKVCWDSRTHLMNSTTLDGLM